MILNRTFGVVTLAPSTAQSLSWTQYSDVQQAAGPSIIVPACVRISVTNSTTLLYVKFDGTAASATNYDVVLPIVSATNNYDADIAVPAGSPSISLFSTAALTTVVTGGYAA